MCAMTRRVFLMGGVSLFPFLYMEKFSLALRRYQVAIRALPPAFEGFTVLHLSDLHDKEFGSAGSSLSQVTRYSLCPASAFLVRASLVARQKAESRVSGSQSGIMSEA